MKSIIFIPSNGHQRQYRETAEALSNLRVDQIEFSLLQGKLKITVSQYFTETPYNLIEFLSPEKLINKFSHQLQSGSRYKLDI